MKKTLSLLTLLMLFMASAWAETVVLSTPSENVSTLSDANGYVTITDATGNTGIQTGSNSYKLSYDGTDYVPMKLSGSRQFNITFSEAITVTKVTLVATSNGDGEGTIGVSSSDRTSLGTFPVRGSDNPLVVDITGVTGLNASRQFICLIAVEYSTTAPALSADPKELAFALSPAAPSQSKSFTLTGKNLANGTYTLTVPAVDGLSVTPTTFTVADGAVKQTFTVTYASTADVAKAAADITATVGDLTATVAVTYQSRATAYTQTMVGADAAWDWSKLTETVELTDNTTPNKAEEFLLADLDDRITFTEAFGDPTAIKMEGMQFPSRGGYAQGTTIKFKTSVPGLVGVTFSNTGGNRPYRILRVNGVDTDFKSNSTEKVEATDISVPAGEVVISGWLDDDENSGPNMLRYYSITFTAQEPTEPEAILFDFQNNNGNWPVGEGSNYAVGEVTEPLTMGGVTLTADQGTSSNAVRIMKINSRGICLQLFKNTSVKFDAPEEKAITKIEVTMQTGSFDLTPSTGEVVDNVWTGNATNVTFGPAAGTRYVWAFAVTLADMNDETVTTGISTVATQTGTPAIFNLQGQRLNGVQKGLNIINGKKVMVK